MNRRLVALVGCLLIMLAGCQLAPAAPAEQPTQAVAETAVSPTQIPPTAEPSVVPAAETTEAVLEVIGMDGTSKSFTMAELQALPAVNNWGGMMSSTGRITAPAMTTGVSLIDLLSTVGTPESGMAVRVIAEDGYAMTISYDQIVSGSFTAYDPGTGKERQTSEPLQAVVVYARDGQPLPKQEEGTLRLGLLNGDKLQVTDGHWWVKWVHKLQLISMSEEWSLQLEGAVSETMDRNTFESCTSPSCHGGTWKDDSSQEWQGVPLYYLTGRVDDENTHEGLAFNQELAEKGYIVELIAADGYTVTLDSKVVQGNKNIMLANLANEAPLDEKYFPLRLVGAGLEKGQMAGQIEKIVVHVPPIPETTPTAEPTAEVESTAVPAATGAALAITGAVASPQSWTKDALDGMEIALIEAEHPKKGMQAYRGVRLAGLLELADPTDAAKTLSITASDGYSMDVPVAEVLACADCMLAFGDENVLNAVMPGFESGAWVKDVTILEVK